MASLRDSLKELENPASTVNFEDSDDEFTFAKVADGAEENIDDKEDEKKFGNLRKKAALQEKHFEKKYLGNKVSRKKIDEWSDEDLESENEDADSAIDEESLEENDEEIESDIEDIDNKADEEDIEDEVESDEEEPNNQDASSDEEEVEEEEEEVENGEESEYEDDDDLGEIHLDISKIPKDLLGGQQLPTKVEEQDEIVEEDDDEEDGDVDNFSAPNKKDEKKKGEATKLQLDMMDKLLETRIRLQKSMQLSNTLPQKENIKIFIKEGGPQVQQSYQDAKSSLGLLLNNLLKLQAELLESNDETENLLHTDASTKKHIDDHDEEIPSDTDEEEGDNENGGDQNGEDLLKLPSKRKSTLSIDDFEEELSKRHKSLCTFRDSTITKWYDKTRLMTGKMNKGFSAFETSTLQQIKQVLADRERLVKRSQLKRTTYKILGKVEEIEKTQDGDEVDSHLKNYDEEIFDDSDFYHEMLKELIERKSNLSANEDDPVASGRRWLELQKLRTKVKKKVDTRASKGRKVRYDVHSKLISFMAPQEVGTMSDQARNDLFSSLFGGMRTSEVIGR